MSDPLTDLITDVQHNGIRWVTVVTMLALYRKERRNHLLNRRDAALFHNQKIIMQILGAGDQWKDGPKLGYQLTDLPNLRQLFSLLLKVSIHQKRRMIMERLKSRKFWMAILAVIIPVINSEYGLHIDTPTVISVIGGILGYIVVQGHVDATAVKSAPVVPAPSDPNQFIQG